MHEVGAHGVSAVLDLADDATTPACGIGNVPVRDRAPAPDFTDHGGVLFHTVYSALFQSANVHSLTTPSRFFNLETHWVVKPK